MHCILLSSSASNRPSRPHPRTASFSVAAVPSKEAHKRRTREYRNARTAIDTEASKRATAPKQLARSGERESQNRIAILYKKHAMHMRPPCPVYHQQASRLRIYSGGGEHSHDAQRA
ncbi:uncharacterized protein BP5553_01907 [Venustampulla echinocandica]|uniref:Uncharacterized protein n=1 Tax=Venustampulla echinocandica TaxID=2656787 RepID=A0A370U2C3_9HELO|nr:uncharacterized protein BP5553_01907 [Venustampulla echinocandica]RDL41928.1 hypothetical protein BP5553_01907 [Venustampulla echinocandica]